MLLIVSMLRLGDWPELPAPLDDDSKLRMMQCVQVLSHPEPELVKVGVEQNLTGLKACKRLYGTCMAP
jgi:hypothetical protein